jgi:uncharacterized iron-regulated membrane protein
MIGLTGSVLAWPELIGAEMKAMFPYEKSSPNAPQIPLSQAVAAIKRDQPDISAPEISFVFTPHYRFPYYMFMRHEKPFEDALFLVDPYSGKVNPPRRVLDFTTGKIEHLHINLIMEAKGLIANGIFSFFAVFMLLSGLWLWWPSTVGQLKLRLKVKRKASLPRLLRDLHNVMGIYLYAILFVTTATAVFMAYNGSTKDGLEKALDGQNAPPKPITVKPAGQRLPDDELMKYVHAALPDAQFVYLLRPMKPDAPFVVHFESKGFWREGVLNLDPYTGRTISIENDSTASRGHKTMAIMEELHVGLYGGLWSKILYTIAGLMPLGLFISGLLMWWKRKQAEKARLLRRAADASLKVEAGVEEAVAV